MLRLCADQRDSRRTIAPVRNPTAGINRRHGIASESVGVCQWGLRAPSGESMALVSTSFSHQTIYFLECLLVSMGKLTCERFLTRRTLGCSVSPGCYRNCFRAVHAHSEDEVLISLRSIYNTLKCSGSYLSYCCISAYDIWAILFHLCTSVVPQPPSYRQWFRCAILLLLFSFSWCTIVPGKPSPSIRLCQR